MPKGGFDKYMDAEYTTQADCPGLSLLICSLQGPFDLQLARLVPTYELE